MIQTSTPASQNLYDDKAADTCASEGLTEEDQSFYDHIQPQLNKVIKEPSTQTIDFIVKYSQSL